MAMRLLTDRFLPWERPRRAVPVSEVRQLARFVLNPTSIDGVVKRSVLPGRSRVTAYEIYLLDTYFNGNGAIAYRLDHPLVEVALHVSYTTRRVGRRTREEPRDYHLRSPDEARQEAVLAAQLRAYNVETQRLFGLEPTLWLVTEGEIPKFLLPLDLDALSSSAIEVVGDTRITRHVYPITT